MEPLTAVWRHVEVVVAEPVTEQPDTLVTIVLQLETLPPVGQTTVVIGAKRLEQGSEEVVVGAVEVRADVGCA